MRSQFDKVGTGYHVLLGEPTVHATQTIQVPAGKGSAFVTTTGTGVVCFTAWSTSAGSRQRCRRSSARRTPTPRTCPSC